MPKFFVQDKPFRVREVLRTKRSRGVSEKAKVCATGVFYMKGR